MNKKFYHTIQKAIEKKELVPYEKVFNAYSRKDQEEIVQRARYIRAAIELRKLRKILNLSQDALAKKMSVKREFVSRIESGRQNVTIETLYRIAEVTGKEIVLSFR